LEIDSSFVGTRLKAYTREIHWRDTTNYAAALNDDNDYYFDDEQFSRLAAHPVYCAAITWPVVERIWEFIEADNFPMEILATQVHYSEHIQFFRIVSPGDRLLVRGTIAAILPHRAGTRVVIRFDVTDDNGQSVFIEHIGSIMRGVQCVGEGKGEETLPRVSHIQTIQHNLLYQDKKYRDKIVWESDIFINRLQPFIYDGCSDIVFPIHTSKKFARQVGLPDIIFQGTATLAFAIRELINRETDGNPALINSLYARFSGMVIPGTAIKVILKDKTILRDRKNLYFCVLNQQGDYVIKDGFADFAKSPDGVKEEAPSLRR
jgi:acyl dehydratase